MTEHKPVSEMTRPVAVLDRGSLAVAVALATLTVERKNHIPVLGNLRLKGSGESLAVIGTDMDNEIHVPVPGAADSRLDITVPAHMLKDILSKAKDSEMASLEDATLPDGETRCGVDLGGVQFKLNAISATDFPVTFPVGTDHKTTDFEIDAGVLTEMLSKVRFAVSTEETRHYLNGIFLHHSQYSNGLRAVATDGHRLGIMEVEAPAGSAGLTGAIIPRKAVGLLLDIIKVQRKAAGGKLPPVTVSVEPGRIAFCVDSVTLTSKLVDGTFPDYERVIPRSGDAASVPVKAMKEAVTQVCLIGNTKGQSVKLDFSADRLHLSCRDADNGTSETAILCGSAAVLEIGFNARYLLDVLDEMESGDAFVTLTDSGNPAVWTDPADARFKAVLMPMRV